MPTDVHGPVYMAWKSVKSASITGVLSSRSFDRDAATPFGVVADEPVRTVRFRRITRPRSW